VVIDQDLVAHQVAVILLQIVPVVARAGDDEAGPLELLLKDDLGRKNVVGVGRKAERKIQDHRGEQGQARGRVGVLGVDEAESLRPHLPGHRHDEVKIEQHILPLRLGQFLLAGGPPEADQQGLAAGAVAPGEGPAFEITARMAEEAGEMSADHLSGLQGGEDIKGPLRQLGHLAVFPPRRRPAQGIRPQIQPPLQQSGHFVDDEAFGESGKIVEKERYSGAGLQRLQPFSR